MGADMIVAACGHKKDVKPNFQAGVEFVKNMDLDDATIEWLYNEKGLDGDEYFNDDEIGSPKLDEIRKWLVGVATEFEGVINGRETATLHIRDLVVYIVGGMSWGDMPEGCDVVDLMWELGALKSMGFEVDISEPAEPEVTPEEEQAAINSIATARS